MENDDTIGDSGIDDTSNTTNNTNTTNKKRNTLTPGATTADYHHSFINIKNNSDEVIEVDIFSYLTAIENELLSIPNDTFRVKIRPQSR